MDGMTALDSYLNDHLAGSTAALELMDRLIEVSVGNQRERFFRALRADIEADHETLRHVMDLVRASESTVRKAQAWVIEKLSRAKIQLKRNDEKKKEASHGLFLALEALGLGITGKRLLWRALSVASTTLPELSGPDYSRLEERAIEQRDRVETERLKVAHILFGQTAD